MNPLPYSPAWLLKLEARLRRKAARAGKPIPVREAMCAQSTIERIHRSL